MSQERKRKLNLNKREVATQRNIITNLWFCGGAVNLRARPITVNQKPQIICCFFAGDASVWIKAPSLKKKGRKQYVYLAVGNNRALCTLLSRLTPYASTCFPFLFGVSAKCVTQEGRAGCLGGGRMCGDGLPSAVYSGRHQLWIPACS